MKRRAALTGLASAMVVVRGAARAQSQAGLRRIGILMNVGADDPVGQSRIGPLLEALGKLGWRDGKSARIDVRWGSGKPDLVHRYAAELAALAPDVVVTAGALATGPMLQSSRAVPIVFVHVPDPVGAGFVESLARPGGNATGFSHSEFATSGKWLELLKQIAPGVKRAAVIRDPAISAGIGQFGAIQSLAPLVGVDVKPIDARDAHQMERGIAEFAAKPNGGLIVTTSALAGIHSKLIITLAGRYRLPAVYYERFFVAGGGLVSYGPDLVDQFRRAAGYVDRILRGEKPADLPVQAPTKYELVINLRTARTLGLQVSATLLARADEVIE